MAQIKHKSNVYAILRKDLDRKQDVVCAFTRTLEGAENLCDEYSQAWVDSGGEDTSYYYVVGNVFYDK